MQLKIWPWLVRGKERERERKRKGTVDNGWWTELARWTADDGQSLHGDQSLHGGPIPLVLSLSLSLSLRVANVLSKAGNQLKVK